MKRRQFIAGVGLVAATASASAQSKLLLPTDTPDQFHLKTMWYNPVPPIDQAKWGLDMKGLVERPMKFSVGDLRKLPQQQRSARMKCVQCWSGRNTWGGFLFAELVERVKPKRNARAIRIDCADKWYEYMSLEEMGSPSVLMVLDLAGKPLPDNHGAPLRLLDASKYGYKSAKLITSITFVEQGKGSMACDLGPFYSPTGDILAGYDHPLDLGGAKRKIKGGEIKEY
jgi:DMSO/TMAO reductase YedYZ molybdopterin-dependent catalytic subunit